MGPTASGKSTIAEKLTGRSLKPSDTSRVVRVPDGSLIVCDTPGSKPGEEEQYNGKIAGAFNFRPVSKIFIVVKALARMDKVIEDINIYINTILKFPIEMNLDSVTFLVSHMDTVGWSEN